MAGLFEEAVAWLRSPQRTQQLQGIGNALASAEQRARAFNQLNRQATEEFLATGDIYGPRSREVAMQLANAYNPVGMVGARFKGSGAVPTDVPLYGRAKEISDQFSEVSPEMLARATQPFSKESVTLGDVLRHPELYRDYPELARYPVKSLGLFTDPATRAAYGQGTVYLPANSVNLSPAKLKETHSSLLHEVQHAIQELDKMPKGASPSNFLPENIGQSLNAASKSEELSRNSLAEYLTQKYGGSVTWADALFKNNKFTNTTKGDKQAEDLLKQFEYSRKLRTRLEEKVNAAHQSYKQVAGEAQARAIQKRFENPEQYNSPVTESYDLPLLDLKQSPLDYTIR